jgi:hypothetical protein
MKFTNFINKNIKYTISSNFLNLVNYNEIEIEKYIEILWD